MAGQGAAAAADGDVTETPAPAPAKAAGQISLPGPFLTKTYELVDDPAVDDVISWGADGSTFVVWRPADFARDLLPKYFKHDNFSLFVRELKAYEFRKIVPGRWEFAHGCFRRGEKRLLCDIHPRKVIESAARAVTDSTKSSPAAGAVSDSTKSSITMACSDKSIFSDKSICSGNSVWIEKNSMEAPVSALVDAMFRLPAKLDGLLVSHGHMLPRGAADEIPLIKKDLERMVAILREHNDSGSVDHAMLLKCLTKEVRELSYDMEDSVDQYEHGTDSRRGMLLPRRKKHKVSRRRSKATMGLWGKLKWRLWMANKIREFSVRSQEAVQRYCLFNQLSGNVSSTAAASTSCAASFFSWHPTLYSEPVGIDEHVNKLEVWLGKDGEQKLKVISVFGSGGIGKTTLAKELYSRIGGQFECRAFVRTSQKPDVRRLLISMLSQVRPHQPPYTWKVHNLIADIRTHLQDKSFSIYQEGYIIQKDDLVKQWIAEGLIAETGEKNKEEISRSYFDELISSRMIQPVHINDNDEVLSCTVHSMVLDFVTHKSIEDNFVTAIDDCQTTARFADKVRRLSLHFGNAEATTPTNMRLSQLRTLAFFGVFRCLPSIVEFGLLRVLILHLWGDEESIIFDLTRISELFRLRYLHIICNVTLELQQTQMHGLQYLETLKIDARMREVPSEIVHLPGLLHLSLPVEINLPNGIGHMTTLCTLGYFDLSANSVENVQSLGELTNLQDLQLTCATVLSCYLESKMDSMGSILTKLSNLRSLTLEPSSTPEVGASSMSISCDGLSFVSSPPEFLRRFEWLPHICTFSSLPEWIGRLDKLCILKIGVRELVWKDVYVLRGLPALTVLSLHVRIKPAGRIVFDKRGFSALKCFKFWCSVPWLEFTVDSMPNLRKLKLCFDAHGADQHGTVPVGIEHLSGLKKISAKIGGAGADDPDRRAAESALIDTIKMHRARPAFNIQCVDLIFSGKDDDNSWVQEEEHMTPPKQYQSVTKQESEIMEEDSIGQWMVPEKGLSEDSLMSYSPFSHPKKASNVMMRGVAERVRRKKISQRLRKLQELVPDMEKQTNTADMLDLVTDYINELQMQVKVIKDGEASEQKHSAG